VVVTRRVTTHGGRRPGRDSSGDDTRGTTTSDDQVKRRHTGTSTSRDQVKRRRRATRIRVRARGVAMARARALLRTMDVARERAKNDGALIRRALGADARANAWTRADVLRLDVLVKCGASVVAGIACGFANARGAGAAIWGILSTFFAGQVVAMRAVGSDVDRHAEFFEYFLNGLVATTFATFATWACVGAVVGTLPQP